MLWLSIFLQGQTINHDSTRNPKAALKLEDGLLPLVKSCVKK